MWVYCWCSLFYFFAISRAHQTTNYFTISSSLLISWMWLFAAPAAVSAYVLTNGLSARMLKLLLAIDAWTVTCRCAAGHAELNGATRMNEHIRWGYIFPITDLHTPTGRRNEDRLTTSMLWSARSVRRKRKCVEEKKEKLENANDLDFMRLVLVLSFNRLGDV